MVDVQPSISATALHLERRESGRRLSDAGLVAMMSKTIRRNVAKSTGKATGNICNSNAWQIKPDLLPHKLKISLANSPGVVYGWTRL